MQFTTQLARLNSAVALERLGGDEELLREVARLFLEEYPVLLDELRQAVEVLDAEAIQRASHSLKGSVANFGADNAYNAAFALEMMGRTGNLTAVRRGMEDLDEALQYIHPALLELAAESV